MHIFLCYARIDLPTAQNIQKIMDFHDVWYDHRLYAGEKWWPTIVQQIQRCDTLLYLISDQSLKSEYCQKEYQIAANAGKTVLLVIIQPIDVMSQHLVDHTCVDMTNVQDARNVKVLLNSLTLLERQALQRSTGTTSDEPSNSCLELSFNPATFMEDAAEALHNEDYDRVIYLLRVGQSRKLMEDSDVVKAMLSYAEKALLAEARARAIQRDYETLSSLLKRPSTRHLVSSP